MKSGYAILRERKMRGEYPFQLPKPVKRERKRKRPRRQRKSPMAALKRKLWAAFSRYVKERDGAVCFSCGRAGLSGTNWHAGHMFAAGASSLLRYEPKNVHSQCYHCNINLGGNGAAYAQAFIAVYGMDEFMRLSNLSRKMKAWKPYEITELIEALQRGGADYEALYAERYTL